MTVRIPLSLGYHMYWCAARGSVQYEHTVVCVTPYCYSPQGQFVLNLLLVVPILCCCACSAIGYTADWGLCDGIELRARVRNPSKHVQCKHGRAHRLGFKRNADPYNLGPFLVRVATPAVSWTRRSSVLRVGARGLRVGPPRSRPCLRLVLEAWYTWYLDFYPNSYPSVDAIKLASTAGESLFGPACTVCSTHERAGNG